MQQDWVGPPHVPPQLSELLQFPSEAPQLEPVDTQVPPTQQCRLLQVELSQHGCPPDPHATSWPELQSRPTTGDEPLGAHAPAAQHPPLPQALPTATQVPPMQQPPPPHVLPGQHAPPSAPHEGLASTGASFVASAPVPVPASASPAPPPPSPGFPSGAGPSLDPWGPSLPEAVDEASPTANWPKS